MTAPKAGPFYLALVAETETTFGPEHLRMDLYVFSSRRTLAEGQKPAMELEIENPRVGLAAPGRNIWAWFSYDPGSGAVPIIFGRIMTVPVELNAEVITIQLVAYPSDYFQRVQRAAEPLKELPYWDPAWIDASKRDDPDTILETRAAFWDLHPTNHDVMAVSIVDGPDGNVDITDHFYDSLSIAVGDPPATAVLVDMTASWTQTARGVIDAGSIRVPTVTADNLIGSWPKPYDSLGAGLFVRASDAYDSLWASNATTRNWSISYQNKEKTHEDGDCMSASWSSTEVAIGSVAATYNTNMTYQPGIVDPFSVDENGDPSPLNVPMSYNSSSTAVVGSQVEAYMLLEYVAERPRTERAVFLITADTQVVLIDPLVTQDSETIVLESVDLGQPIVPLLNWSSVAGQHVDVDTMIFPDDPDLPGAQVIQVAVSPGTAGTTEPEFSSVAGDTVADGTDGLVWASLGSSTPPDNAEDWQGEVHINTGTMIRPKQPMWVDLSVLEAPSTRNFRPATMSEGEYVRNADGTFGVCTISGQIGVGADPDGLAVMVNFPSMPSGAASWVAVQGGITGVKYVLPDFGTNETMGARVTDNGVIWQCVGIGEIPIGGVPGQIHANNFFPSDRGNDSIVYGALRGRARLLYRGRCVEVSLQVPYDEGIGITTRKTATVHDSRLPGGIAAGKVKSAVLEVSDGTALCTVTVACTLGKDNDVEAVAGDPDYVDDDYVEDDYQSRTGELVLLPNGSDLAYSPPTYTSTDDGLSFPLTLSDILVVGPVVHGSKSAEIASLTGLAAAEHAAVQASILAAASGFALNGGLAPGQLTPLQEAQISSRFPMPSIWVEYTFRPINSGPFHKFYSIKFSNFTMGKGIDLEYGTTT